MATFCLVLLSNTVVMLLGNSNTLCTSLHQLFMKTLQMFSLKETLLDASMDAVIFFVCICLSLAIINFVVSTAIYVRLMKK